MSMYFRQNFNHLGFLFFLACSVTLFLSGCRLIKSAELQALENSTSVMQLSTGREVRRWINDKGKALGKPVYAEILIVYEPDNNHTREDVYNEIVAILKKNKWEGDEPITGRNYFKATLQQDNFEISTGVSIDENKNLVTVVMTIY